MFIRGFLASVFLCTLAAAGHRNHTVGTVGSHNSTIDFQDDGKNLRVVLYDEDWSIVFNGTNTDLVHRPPQNKQQLQALPTCFPSFSKTSKALVSLYTIGQLWSKSEATACIEGLRLIAANDCDKKTYSAVSGSCTCMFKFGSAVDNNKNAATNAWFQFMKDRIGDYTFHGAYALEYSIGESDMIAASVDCRNSWAFIAGLSSRWAKGKWADKADDQWKAPVEIYVARSELK
ncbi:hypothetical protein BGX23_003271 [Mortierella sp. AD031]|nr:hypothetical protein BGX23_003271 [Mortierella sp. AD031]